MDMHPTGLSLLINNGGIEYVAIKDVVVVNVMCTACASVQSHAVHITLTTTMSFIATYSTSIIN